MRALVFEEFGEPADVLALREVPRPSPGPHDVRVRIIASPVNPSDLMTIRGTYGKRPRLPATPGYEGVGVVESSGGDILGRYLQNQLVAVPNRRTGNWCDYVVVPAGQVIPLPANFPLEQGAMFFVNPMTAYVMTRKVLQIPKGEWLLQTAAGSAVGKMVIRLGKHFGFKTINVVRRLEQIEELEALGADEVLVLDDERVIRDDLQSLVLHLTQYQGVKYAIDPVGGETGSAVIGGLGENGRLLVYGTLDDEPLQFSSRQLMTVGSQVEGFWLARWMQTQGMWGKLKLVKKISRLMKAGVLVSDVDGVYPLERFQDAVRRSEQPGRRGKVLLQTSQET